MTASEATAWAALVSIPIAAVLAVAIRRFKKGSFVRKMRPHFWVGYAALALAAVHSWLSAGSMGGTSGTGIRLATGALGGLALQAFVGTNLQSPGIYRRVLRRWHVGLFIVTLLLAIGHIAMNAG